MFRLKFEGNDHELLVHASLGAASVMLDEYTQMDTIFKKTGKERPITHVDYISNYKETKKFIWTALMLLGPQRIKGFDAQWIAIEGLSEQWIKEQFGFFSTFSRKSTYTTWFKKSSVPYDLSQFTSKEFDKEFGHHIPDSQPQLKKQVSQILCESFISSYFDISYDSIGLNCYTDKPITIFSLLALGPRKLAQAFKQTAKKPKKMDFRNHEAHFLNLGGCLTALIRSLPESVKEIDLAENEFKQLRTEDLVKILSAIPPQVNQLNLSGNELLYFSQADSDKIRAALPKTVTQVKWGDLGTARKFIGYFSVTDGVARLRSPDGSPLHDYWRRLSPAQLKETQEEFPKEAQSFDLGEIDASLFGSQCLQAILDGANVSELYLDKAKNLHRLGGERVFNIFCEMRGKKLTTLHLEFAELAKLGLDGLIAAFDAIPDSVKTFKFRDSHANLLSPQDWHMLYHSLPAGKTQWIESFAPVSKAYLQGPPPQYFTLQGTVAKLNNPQGGNIDTYWSQKGWRQIRQVMKSFPKEAKIMDFSGHDASVLGGKCLELLIDALPESINELWLDLKNFHCLDEKEGLDVCFLGPISRSKNISKILLEPNELGKLAPGRIEKFIFRLCPRVLDVIEPSPNLQLTKPHELSPSSHETYSRNTASHLETKPVPGPLKETIPLPQVAPQSASTPQELKPLAHADSTPSPNAKSAHCLGTSNPHFFPSPTAVEETTLPQAEDVTEQRDSLLGLLQEELPNMLHSVLDKGRVNPGTKPRVRAQSILALAKHCEEAAAEDCSKISLSAVQSLFVSLMHFADEYQQGYEAILPLQTELMVLFPDLGKEGLPVLPDSSPPVVEEESRTFSLC